MDKKISFLALGLAVFALIIGFVHIAHNQVPSKQEAANERVARTKTIRCGYILYPPYLEKNAKTNKLQGIAYDLFEQIARTLHDKVEWVEEVPVGGEVATLEKGSVDAICGITGAYDANAFGQVSFSDYLFIVKNRIFARANDDRFRGPIRLADIDKAEISFAGIEGDTSFIFPQMLTPHARTKSLPALSEPAQLFQEVMYGKEDLLMLEAAPGMKAMQANPNAFKIVNIEDALPAYAAQIAFSKKDEELRDTVNETIRFMKLNGQFEPILDKFDPTGRVLIRAN